MYFTTQRLDQGIPGGFFVEMPPEIVLARTEIGDCPVEEFLDSLPAKDAHKVTQVLEFIREHPGFVPKKFLKKLSGQENLWEIRATWMGNAYRLLAFLHRVNQLVLLSGFRKKTQETPKREIDLAQDRKKRYFRLVGHL